MCGSSWLRITNSEPTTAAGGSLVRCSGALQERSRASGRDLPGDRLYQFRLAFDSTQAKGACKVMEDDVAEVLGADIILPESSVKPEYKGPSRFLDLFRSDARQARSPNLSGTYRFRHSRRIGKPGVRVQLYPHRARVVGHSENGDPSARSDTGSKVEGGC